MDSTYAITRMIESLDTLQIEYVMVGALATNVYGIPRSTQDADIVVALADGDLSALMKELGEEFHLDPQILLESMTGTLRNDITFLPIGFRIDLFRLSDDPHHRDLFEQRVQLHVPEIDRDVWIPRAEDIVIQKLRWARNKDLDDAASVVGVQGTGLDIDYIRSWTDRHASTESLNELLASVLPDSDEE